MKTAILLSTFGIVLIFSGCVTLYKPNAIHSPLLKNKGDLNTSALLGLSGEGLSNMQAAYALSNHTGILIDGMYHNKRTNRDNSSTEKLNVIYGEAGGGYFTTFGTNKTGLFQCYTGGGYGFSKDVIKHTESPDPKASAKYFNLFIQPGIAYLAKEFEFSFDLKANYVQLFNIEGYLFDKFEWWNTNFKYHSNATLDFMNIEPVITCKAGKGRVKGIMQLGIIIPAINSKSYFDVNTSSLLIAPLFKFSVGVSYSISRK